MLWHDVRQAWWSFRRSPWLTVLIIGAMAAGIGTSLITLTLYHARAGNPIWWKSDRLFAVTLDNRLVDPQSDGNSRHPEYPPFMLTWRDAQAIYRSDIPVRSARMFASRRLIDPQRPGVPIFRAATRVTSADFFAMFDVPFLYGTGWPRTADEAPEPVVVISKAINDRVFGGVDSVGRSINVSGRPFRVVGVIDGWMPQPRFYDLSGAFDPSEGIFLPFGWTTAWELPAAGPIRCLSNDQVGSFKELLAAECVWLQVWAELASDEQRARYQQFLDNYVREQKEAGRFPRPLNNRLADVSTWLDMNDVVGDKSRILVAVALLFLAVCVLNTLGLMLARFLGAAPISGLRRALGATRRDIVRQHLTEVMLMGLIGGIAGLGLAKAGLWLLHVLLFLPMARQSINPQAQTIAHSMTHLDGQMVLAALAMSLIAGLAAGLYPAWRIGRLQPASFLKSQ
ncbi:MAG TPA: ABC transporter permease [Povalibacter sp.]|nr:ABC transporter permease [Povalibacter sp.]